MGYDIIAHFLYFHMSKNPLWLFAFFFGYFSYTPLNAQEIHGNNQIWLQSNFLYRIDTHWKAGLELHLRFDDYFKQKQQAMVRPFIDYIISPSLDITVGYTYSDLFPYGEYPLPSRRKDYNMFEQFTIKQKVRGINLSHRYRFEQRWIQTWDSTQKVFTYDKPLFLCRFRYRITSSFQLSPESSILAFNEIFVSSSKKFKSVFFDRNWFSVGYSRDITPYLNVHLSYLHQYAQNNPLLYERHNGVLFLAVFSF